MSTSTSAMSGRWFRTVYQRRLGRTSAGIAAMVARMFSSLLVGRTSSRPGGGISRPKNSSAPVRWSDANSGALSVMRLTRGETSTTVVTRQGHRR